MGKDCSRNFSRLIFQVHDIFNPIFLSLRKLAGNPLLFLKMAIIILKNLFSTFIPYNKIFARFQIPKSTNSKTNLHYQKRSQIENFYYHCPIEFLENLQKNRKIPDRLDRSIPSREKNFIYRSNQIVRIVQRASIPRGRVDTVCRCIPQVRVSIIPRGVLVIV